MDVTTKQFVDVRERARELECDVPSGVALLPRNFDTAGSKDELLYEASTTTIRKLLNREGIALSRIESEDDRLLHFQQNAFEWIGPVLLISWSAYANNPHVISVTLGVISNYVTEFFKGIPGPGKVKLDIVVEDGDGNYVSVHCEGDQAGMDKLPEIIAAARDGRKAS